MSSKPTLKVTADFTDQFNDMIKRFRNDSVLVGIPADAAAREPEPGEPANINNATILAINEFGSEVQGIPPRPVMKIGIKNAQDAIAEQFKKCAQSSLKVGLSALDVYYERAGIIASSSIKKVINSQEGIQHIAFSTALARLRKGFKGDKALIVTGQLRNAITYVVKKGGF